MFEPTALQVRIERLLHVGGQGLALLGEVRDERGVVLLHQPVEPGVLGAVARVGESTGGFPAVCVHRLRVLAQAGGDSVYLRVANSVVRFEVLTRGRRLWAIDPEAGLFECFAISEKQPWLRFSRCVSSSR